MKIVSTSYINTPAYTEPVSWLKRIDFFTGLLEELAKKFEVHSIERISFNGKMEQGGVHYHFIDLKKNKTRIPFRLHRLVAKLKPDIVLIHGLCFPAQVIQLRWKLGKKARIILVHQAEKPFIGIKKWLQQLADRKVDAYIFAAKEFGDEWMKKGIIKDPGKTHAIVPAASIFHTGDKVKARSNLNIPGSPVFLWVGRLNANKDPLTVIKAFIRFLLVQPSARFYMIYQEDDLLDEIKNLTRDHQQVLLIGKIRHEKLGDWYNAADFYISGSHYEGAGTAVSEAMSCGCIPVLTDIISFRAMTGQGSCGILYEPGNENDLLAALVKTTAMDPEIERSKALSWYENELSFKAIARKMENLFKALNKQ